MSDVENKVVPRGVLLSLAVNQLRASVTNPRQLFDQEPLQALKQSIRLHGVLVPLTVYKLPGVEKYGIVDGERRFLCCSELAEEGNSITVPANVVAPPDAMASLIYMFNIHSFREQWELMPTAVGLQRIIDHLGGDPSDRDLHELTGLSDPQIRRCRVILSFPARYQELSLDPNPKTRIPSNFWIELSPVLDIVKRDLKDVVDSLSAEGVIDRFVEKYRARKIKSVVHFRRIVEAFETADELGRGVVAQRLRDYISNINLETRAAFDEFIVDQRRKQKVTDACDLFVRDLVRARIDYISEAEDVTELINGLKRVRSTVNDLIERLLSTDPPTQAEED